MAKYAPESNKPLQRLKSLSLQLSESLLCKVNGPKGSNNPIRRDVGIVRTLRLLWGSALELAWYLGGSVAWVVRFAMLLSFVVVMLPAFVPVAWHFVFSKRILKNITYGPSIRHQLDVYLPSEQSVGQEAQAKNKCHLSQIFGALNAVRARSGGHGSE